MTSSNLCQSKIVFIDVDDIFSVEPLIPYLENLHKLVPSAALDYELIPLVTAPYVDLAVDQLENMVETYYNRGYRYIGLPSQSTLLRPFLLGTGGSLNNVPIDRRWPDINFMVQETSIAAVNIMSNVYRFQDVNTLLSPELLAYNINEFIEGPGKAYVIYQGAGDAYSSRLTNEVLAVLLDMDVTTHAFEVGNTDNTFNIQALEEAVDFISETIPPAPARSVIINIINGLFTTEFTNTALEAGFFTDFEGKGIHYSYTFDYWPNEIVLPVDLHYGKIPVTSIPSLQAFEIGLPSNPAEYFSFPYWFTYFDAYLWAATCGDTDGFNDKQLKFDSQGTRIAYFLANYYFPANSNIMQLGPFYFNPRWFDPNASVVPVD